MVRGVKMGPLSVIAILGFILGLLQIIFPDVFVILKVQGTKKPSAIRRGGFIVVSVSTILFIIDLVE